MLVQCNVDSFEFGIIPSQVMKQIGDQENFKLRAQGVEELKSIIRELQTSDISSSLMKQSTNAMKDCLIHLQDNTKIITSTAGTAMISEVLYSNF